MVTRANYDAVNATVKAMRALGQLDTVDAALVAAVRSSARALDAVKPGSAASAACARAHLGALDQLRKLSAHDDATIGRLLDELAVPAAVGDTPEP